MRLLKAKTYKIVVGIISILSTMAVLQKISNNTDLLVTSIIIAGATCIAYVITIHMLIYNINVTYRFMFNSVVYLLLIISILLNAITLFI